MAGTSFEAVRQIAWPRRTTFNQMQGTEALFAFLSSDSRISLCIEVYPKHELVTTNLKVAQKPVKLEEWIFRATLPTWHYGHGPISALDTIMDDFSQKAQPLIRVARRIIALPAKRAALHAPHQTHHCRNNLHRLPRDVRQEFEVG